MSSSPIDSSYSFSKPALLAVAGSGSVAAALLLWFVPATLSGTILMAILVALVLMIGACLAAAPPATTGRAGASPAVSPCVIWLTGLPSSGKTTLSNALADRLRVWGVRYEQLDGDAVRAVLPGVGFSRDQRDQHIRRMGHLCSLLEKHGVVVISSFVSPYEESRRFARSLCRSFLEIHLSTDLAACAERDVKGLYRKAADGKLQAMTGVDDPYEIPASPELRLDTASLSEEESVEQIFQMMASRGLIDFGRCGAGKSEAVITDGTKHGSSFAARAR